MALDRRMAALRARHAREISSLFREFTKCHPAVEVGVSASDLTPAQTGEWRKFSSEKIASQVKERSELAAKLRAETGRHHAIRVG